MANQAAFNALMSQGQANANSIGTCTAITCNFVMNTGYANATSNMTNYGTSVQFYLVFYPTSGSMVYQTSYHIATISAGCRPSATRTFSASSGGRTWDVTIFTNGQVHVRLISGSNLLMGSSASISSTYVL